MADLSFTRITRKYVKFPVTATKADGSPVTVTDVFVALLPHRAHPTQATVWTASQYADGVAKVLVAGPDAEATNAVVLTGDVDVWARITDNPEVEAAKVGSIYLD